MKEYIIVMRNVKGKIIQAKSNDAGYWSYLFAIKSPTEDETKYLYHGKTGYSIWLQSGEKEQTLSEKQDITISELGIEEYPKKDGGIGYSGHIIRPEGSIKDMYEKETKKEVKKDPIKEEPKKVAELTKEVAEQNLWELYFQRLELILSLFKDKGIITDTALAGAILGLRELMLNKRF